MATKRQRIWKRYRWVRRQSEKLYYYATFIWRKAQTKASWEDEKAANYKKRVLTPEEKAEVRRVWKDIKVDDKWFVLYNSIKREGDNRFDARYVPLDIFYCFIDEWYNNDQEAYALDDKNMYDLYFHDVHRPKTIVRKMNGNMLDESYMPLSMEQAVQLCKQQKSVIKKPTLYVAGGEGIVFWDEVDGEGALVDILEKGSNYVVQGIVHQHPDLAALHKESVNTVRIITFYFEGEMMVLSSLLRIGVGEARMDNACAGGVFCGIRDDGSLKRYAYSKHGVAYETHPQGGVYAEHKVPGFDRCKALVLDLANRFVRVSKLVSWDLAVGEDGEPVLIEVNLSYGGADIHQIANGPLFGEKTEQVIRHALNTKTYRRYKKRL